MNDDVSVYLGRQRVDGRGGPTQSHALCINEQYKDLKSSIQQSAKIMMGFCDAEKCLASQR